MKSNESTQPSDDHHTALHGNLHDPNSLTGIKPNDWISRRISSVKWLDYWEEVKLQCYLAGPLITVSMLQMAFQIISIMFVGHLGELALSSCSVATSVANVTGLCLMMGMASGMETLCGQSFGAKQYQMLGLYLQRGLILLNTTAIPFAFIYGYMGKILVGLGQDKAISQEAGNYARWLIPTLFAHASSQPLIRFLQTQSLVYPMVMSSGSAIACHVPLCWVLVYKTGLGYRGAALSTSICNWINVALLLSYVGFSPSCHKTRAPLSWEALHGMKSFLRLAIPSAAMVCLNFANITFQIPFGIASSVSTRVSNELGAGRPQVAQNAVRVAMGLSMSQALIVSMLLFCFHNVLGHAFSNDLEVIESVAAILQLLAISSILDSTQAVLSGIARGCGWQSLGALINLSSFYMVALPVGCTLGFLTPLKAKGLWIGVICGPFVQIIALGTITWATNWEKEVHEAKKRVESSSSLTSPLLLH